MKTIIVIKHKSALIYYYQSKRACIDISLTLLHLPFKVRIRKIFSALYLISFSFHIIIIRYKYP